MPVDLELIDQTTESETVEQFEPNDVFSEEMLNSLSDRVVRDCLNDYRKSRDEFREEIRSSWRTTNEEVKNDWDTHYEEMNNLREAHRNDMKDMQEAYLQESKDDHRKMNEEARRDRQADSREIIDGLMAALEKDRLEKLAFLEKQRLELQDLQIQLQAIIDDSKKYMIRCTPVKLKPSVVPETKKPAATEDTAQLKEEIVNLKKENEALTSRIFSILDYLASFFMCTSKRSHSVKNSKSSFFGCVKDSSLEIEMQDFSAEKYTSPHAIAP